jgi:hypothetical protein
MSRNARCKLVFAVALGTLFHACGLFYVYTIRLRVCMTSSCAPKPFNTTVSVATIGRLFCFHPDTHRAGMPRGKKTGVIHSSVMSRPSLRFDYPSSEINVKSRARARAKKTKEKGTMQGLRSHLRYIEARCSRNATRNAKSFAPKHKAHDAFDGGRITRGYRIIRF